jgi:hypothetical protein
MPTPNMPAPNEPAEKQLDRGTQASPDSTGQPAHAANGNGKPDPDAATGSKPDDRSSDDRSGGDRGNRMGEMAKRLAASPSYQALLALLEEKAPAVHAEIQGNPMALWRNQELRAKIDADAELKAAYDKYMAEMRSRRGNRGGGEGRGGGRNRGEGRRGGGRGDRNDGGR